MSETYNKYVQKESLRQVNNDGLSVYKVRKPRPEEEVVGYNNLAESIIGQTLTEKAEVKNAS